MDKNGSFHALSNKKELNLFLKSELEKWDKAIFFINILRILFVLFSLMFLIFDCGIAFIGISLIFFYLFSYFNSILSELRKDTEKELGQNDMV